MKSKLLLIVIAFLSFNFVSCEDENSETEAQIEGVFDKSVESNDVNYKRGLVVYEYTNNVLVIKHYVCYTSVGSLTDSIKAEVSANEDEIVIDEIIDNTSVNGFSTNGLFFKENVYTFKNVKPRNYHVCISTYDPVYNWYYDNNCLNLDLSTTMSDSLILEEPTIYKR